MSDENITKQNSVVDSYIDHPQHFTWRDDCSECAKNIRDFDGVDSEDDVELDVGVDIEHCNNCGVLCDNLYCLKCDKEITDYEFSRQEE